MCDKQNASINLLSKNECFHTVRCRLRKKNGRDAGCFGCFCMKNCKGVSCWLLVDKCPSSRERTAIMSDAASENDMKRPQMANPYLKEKPTAVDVALSEESFSATSNASTTVAKLPAHKDETEPNCTNNTIAAAGEPTLLGSNQPAVERLPSRSVSFGSAEILTVTELHQHVLSYNNQSVRITGVVLHRLVAADGSSVCLVLSDPKQQAQLLRMPPSSSSVWKTTPVGGGGIQRRGGTTPRFVSRKRPLAATVPTKTPLEAAVTSLAEQPSVLVHAVSEQVPINDVAVGDLVMIIGELRSICNNTTIAAMAIIQDIVEHDNNSSAQHFVHARIVRNVNGTDMALHDEALRMRRQHLLQTCPESKDLIRQGCGPPPYYDPNKKEASV